MEELRLHQMNDVRMIGRVTRDPEIKYTTKGDAFLRLTMALNRSFKDREGNWQEDTTFVPISLWRDAAQRCYENVKKGSPIFVEGRLRSYHWETEEKEKRSILEVDVRRVQFLARQKSNFVSTTPSDPQGTPTTITEMNGNSEELLEPQTVNVE